ncbi:hypothetical protein ACLB2K_002311 [Fragaria x ananassa]
MTAVGIDANNGMYPIAYDVVEVENQDTWTWFLEYLKWDLEIEWDNGYTFMIDKQKGLGNAIANLFPNAEHRHCVRHLYNNFKAKHPGEGLKQMVWNAARSSTVVWYKRHMADLKELSEQAWTWFQDKNPAQWSRAYFREDSSGFGGVGYSEVKHDNARVIPRWVTYWEAAPELPETKPGFGGVGYSEVKHDDARAIPRWVTYWEAVPELPETKP